jgi:hypothetical protein
MRCFRGPTGEIGGTKIRCVKFGSRNIGHAVDATNPVAAGFQPCRPGSVSRAAKLGSSAIAKGVMLSAIPLAVADLTKSRREILIVPRLYWRNSFFIRFVGTYWQASLTIFGRGSTRPAALRNFNAA